MYRFVTALLIASATPVFASPLIDDRLEQKLEEHFEDVDMAALPTTARQRATEVLQSSADQTEQFLALHSILSRHNAIVHIDIHGMTDTQVAGGI